MKEYFDPKVDAHLAKDIQSMMERGKIYTNECKGRDVKFLPRQVIRPLLVKAGLQEGPMLKPRSEEFYVIDLDS